MSALAPVCAAAALGAGAAGVVGLGAATAVLRAAIFPAPLFVLGALCAVYALLAGLVWAAVRDWSAW